jgi:hypothetical protein
MICAREEVVEFSGRDRKYTPEYFFEEFDITEDPSV